LSTSIIVTQTLFDKPISNTSESEFNDDILGEEPVGDYIAYFRAYWEVVFFSYIDDTYIQLYNSTEELVWDGTLNKGEYQYLDFGHLAMERLSAYGTKRYSVLYGDPYMNGGGHFAVDEEGRALGTDFYTLVPDISITNEDPRLIIFAYEDNTAVDLEYIDGPNIWSGTLDKGEYYENINLPQEYVHVTGTKPFSVLTAVDIGFFVPSSNGSFTGTHFYTWNEPRGPLQVYSYYDGNFVTVRFLNNGTVAWSGMLERNEKITYSAPEDPGHKYYEITSTKNVTVSVNPFSHNFAHLTSVADCTGRGIGSDFLFEVSNSDILVFAYHNYTTVRLVNPYTKELISVDVLNAGEHIDVNPKIPGEKGDFYRIISDKEISISTGMGGAGSAFAFVYDRNKVIVPELQTIMLNTTLAANKNDIILNWSLSANRTSISHYLIYRSEDQNDFNFSEPWVDTYMEINPVSSVIDPLERFWMDEGAADSQNPNFSEQYYYIVRAIDTCNCFWTAISNTAGKYTLEFDDGINTFSLPLKPPWSISLENLMNDMGASTISWLDANDNWQTYPENSNAPLAGMGKGYVVEFENPADFTFTGEPASMIRYTGGFGFDRNMRNDISASVDTFGNVIVDWTPILDAEKYYVYRSNIRHGFFTEEYDVFEIISPPFQDSGAAAIVGELYYMVVPYNSTQGEGSSTYSIGVITTEYHGNEMIGLPLKPVWGVKYADWYVDQIPNALGIVYLDSGIWKAHFKEFPEGVYDTILEVGRGYEVSVYAKSLYTYIGW
jgi:hypothetical protein